tara:strand:- start:18155 stop:18628 length:474 start_codon:yes stop_codon:yes gene_type:complete
MKKIITVHMLVILLSLPLFGQSINNTKSDLVTGEQYVTGNDGIVRIYINIWGHVKSPGTYLVYDGADLINTLSFAGGPLEGSNLRKIEIISKNKNESQFVDLENLTSSDYDIRLNPFDTIIVKQTLNNKLFSRSSVIQVFLQLISLIYTIDQLGDDS